jgi:transposase-like protein
VTRAAEFPAPAVACPFCGSKSVETNTAKKGSSYWRCGACREVWHPDRLQSRVRVVSNGRFAAKEPF